MRPDRIETSPASAVAATLRGLWTLASGTERRRKGLLAVVFTILVLVQGWANFGKTWAGFPYEGWDEIATFNNSHVLSGPNAEARTPRYGSLDTLLQWGALIAYRDFDPLGQAYPHVRYANTAPTSWDDPFFVFKEKDWNGADYNYFRGVDDRRPIFTSRQVHLVVAYGLVLAMGLAALIVLGEHAMFVMPPLMLFSAGPETFFQAAQSLPNTINGVLAFGIVLFAMLYADRTRLRYLLISVGLLALAMNFKTDILIFVGAAGLALGVVLLRRGWRLTLWHALWAFAVGVVVTVGSRPGMLLDPIMDTRLRYSLIRNVATGQSEPDMLLVNWRNMLDFFGDSLLWPGVSGILPALAVGAILIGVFLGAVWRRAGPFPVLAIAACVALVAWAVSLRVPGVSDRYFMNGLAAFLALIAMGLVFAAQRGGRWLAAARIAAAALAVLWGAHALAEGRESLAVPASYAKSGGYDPGHNRNLASLEAIRIAQARGFDGQVLIDQHAYIDLRPFRRHGIDARYVNMNTLDDRLAAIDPARRHIVVFTKGSYAEDAPAWKPYMGRWPPETQRSYDAYQARLLSLPVAARFAGRPQAVLSAAPVEPKDEVFVSILPASHGAP